MLFFSSIIPRHWSVGVNADQFEKNKVQNFYGVSKSSDLFHLLHFSGIRCERKLTRALVRLHGDLTIQS